MKSPIQLFGLLVAVGAVAIAALPAQAEDNAVGGAVFVQTNDIERNAIAAYNRNPDGMLTYAASYPTGGLGARATDAGTDRLRRKARWC